MRVAVVKDIQELPAVLNVSQVQKFLGLSKPMAYALCHMEGFPTIRIGRCIRISREGLIRWLERQQSEGNSGE